MSTITESSSIDNFFQFDPQTNLWSVFFHDPANLPIEKIKKCFNQFGTIESVDRFIGIQEKQLCFINYTTEDAVKRCIQHMRSHRFPIHLKRFSFDNINPEYGGKKEGPHAKSRNKRKGSVNSLNSMRPSEDGKSKDDEITTKTENTSTTEFDTSEIPSDLSPKNNKEEIIQGNRKSSIESLKILRKSALASSSGSINSLKSSKITELPDLIVRTPKISPVSSPDFYQSPQQTIIQHVTAHDVIVANIHEACGINFLQLLFANYEPLYISRIEIIPKNNIRYCHVYFSDEQTAEIVERVYDKCTIDGIELIVMRVNTLATQGESDQ